MPTKELETFLFSDLDIEPNGMPLSVLSALARLGLDPWQEARELSALPRGAAVTRLARILIAMPTNLWSDSDARQLAERLAILLPGGCPASNDARPAVTQASRHQLATIVLIGSVFTWMILGLSGHRPDAARADTMPHASASTPGVSEIP